MKVLIVGAHGSIGLRHTRNLRQMGHTVAEFDTGTMDADSTYIRLSDAVQDHHDAILIATPPATHLSIATACLAAKVPLFIEKPLGLDVAEAEAFLQQADAAGVPVAVGYQLRAHVQRQAVKVRIQAGSLGTVYAAHAEFACLNQGRMFPASYTAGITADASHELDMLCWYLGKPISVQAGSDTDGKAGETVCMGTIDFESGVRATFHLDAKSPVYRRSVTVYGDKAVDTVGFDVLDNDEAYREEVRAWLNGTPYCTGREALTTVKVMAAIQRSCASGNSEKVGA